MFVLLPIVFCSQLISSLVLAVLSSFYGLGLILLAYVICNVRQETSRNSLCEFLKYVAVDHLLAAATTCGCIVLLVINGGSQWLSNSLDNDQSTIVGLATILAFFVLVFVFVGSLLLLLNSDFKAQVSTPQQLRWVSWTNVLIIIGLVLNLPTFGIVLVIASPLLWHLNKMNRIGRQSSLIWTLAIAVRQGLPLGKEVAVLADGLWGRHRLRLQRLSENLDAGLSLTAALDRQPGLVPLSAIMLIRTGEESNCLVPALESCAVGFARQHDRHAELISAEQTLMLLVIPFFAMPFIGLFSCTNIVPKFKKIFADFGMELPPVTTNFITVADLFVRWSPLFLGLGTVGGIAFAIRISWRDWERDWPLLQLLAPRLDGPPILRGLAMLIHQQRPVVTGIQAMSTSHPRRSARRRLEAIHRQLLEGRDLADSLADQRLIRRGDVVLLRTAERVGNLPWVLDQLAELMEHKFWYRLRLLMEIGFPIGIVLAGIAVLVTVLAFFMPLIQLIETLSGVN